ncbi:hypothetical protein [Aliikangiella maris]|uniref:Lipoprotein n=2 Tax=Aliikangiella maris TaxID=3162458 RepID=A0ABV3MRD9_9GAMM
MKKILLAISLLLLTSCGDFPDYSYDRSENYCVLTFPFAGGFIGRKYVGYFYITSTLQYLDADPEVEIFIGEPSHIELEEGSVFKIELNGKEFLPEFKRRLAHGELQYWGPAFLFDRQQSTEILQLLRQGHNPIIYGRLKVGHQYETEIYNFFFDDKEVQFKSCVNRLLNEDDLEELSNREVNSKPQ